jgi:hypothetical protein
MKLKELLNEDEITKGTTFTVKRFNAAGNR